MIHDVDDKSFLKKFNFSNTTVLHILRKEQISFHRICSFSYNILVLVFQSDGSNTSYMKGKSQDFYFTLEAGYFYFIPAGHTVEYNLQPDIGYYTFHVGFEIYPGLDLYSPRTPCITGDGTTLIREIDSLWQLEADHLRKACAIRALLLQFFLAHWPERREEHWDIPEEFQTLGVRLQQECDATWTVAKIAEQLGLSPDTFTRKFRTYFGITPKKYMENILMRKISNAFSRKKNTLRAVANELHFSSEFYLSCFIRKNTGIPVSQFRKQLQQYPGNW